MERLESNETSYAAVPRIIWMLWFQGWDNAPNLCLEMLMTWRAYNPDWEIRTICSHAKMLGELLQGLDNLDSIYRIDMFQCIFIADTFDHQLSQGRDDFPKLLGESLEEYYRLRQNLNLGDKIGLSKEQRMVPLHLQSWSQHVSTCQSQPILIWVTLHLVIIEYHRLLYIFCMALLFKSGSP